MANDVTGFQTIYYDRRVQQLLERSIVSKEIASMAVRGNLVKGTTVKRPRYAAGVVSDYTKYTDVTFNDITTAQDTLTIDQSKSYNFKLDEVDTTQSDFSLETAYAKDAALRLRNDLDGKFFDEITNAGSYIDDGSIGGTAGNAIAVTSTNVVNAIGTGISTLRAGDVTQNLAVVVDPFIAQAVMEKAAATGFQMGDTTYKNGYTGDFLGAKLYISNSLRATVSLGIATNPTEGDTVVINGVTFTFNATPSGAGSVDIGANAAASVDNLVAAINGGAGAGTNYIALSATNRIKLTNARVVATDNTTAIGITASGRMTLAETLTASADGFAAQFVHGMICQPGAIDMVIQKGVKTSVRPEPKQLVDNYITHTLYGLKTFTEGAERLLDFRFRGTATTIA